MQVLDNDEHNLPRTYSRTGQQQDAAFAIHMLFGIEMMADNFLVGSKDVDGHMDIWILSHTLERRSTMVLHTNTKPAL